MTALPMTASWRWDSTSFLTVAARLAAGPRRHGGARRIAVLVVLPIGTLLRRPRRLRFRFRRLVGGIVRHAGPPVKSEGLSPTRGVPDATIAGCCRAA